MFTVKENVHTFSKRNISSSDGGEYSHAFLYRMLLLNNDVCVIDVYKGKALSQSCHHVDRNDYYNLGHLAGKPQAN